MSRDVKSNKQFFTFHRPQGQSHQDWGGRGGGTTSPRARVTSPSPRTRGSGGSTSPRNRGSRQLMASHSRTMEPKKVEKAFDYNIIIVSIIIFMDDHNVNIQVAASKSFCGSSGAEREREGRRRQEDFLPRLVGLCDHVNDIDDDSDDNIFCAGTPGLRRRSGPDLTLQTW